MDYIEDVLDDVSKIEYWQKDENRSYTHRDGDFGLQIEPKSDDEILLKLAGSLPGTEQDESRIHFRQSLESAYAQIALSDEYESVGIGNTISKTPQATVKLDYVQQAARELGEVGSDIVEHYWNSIDQTGRPDL